MNVSVVACQMACKSIDTNVDYVISKTEACSLMAFLDTNLMPWPCSLDNDGNNDQTPTIDKVGVSQCIKSCVFFDNNDDNILVVNECCKLKQHFTNNLFAKL